MRRAFLRFLVATAALAVTALAVPSTAHAASSDPHVDEVASAPATDGPTSTPVVIVSSSAAVVGTGLAVAGIVQADDGEHPRTPTGVGSGTASSFPSKPSYELLLRLLGAEQEVDLGRRTRWAGRPPKMRVEGEDGGGLGREQVLGAGAQRDEARILVGEVGLGEGVNAGAIEEATPACWPLAHARDDRAGCGTPSQARGCLRRRPGEGCVCFRCRHAQHARCASCCHAANDIS